MLLIEMNSGSRLLCLVQTAVIDKVRLSFCVGGVHRIGDKSRLLDTENFETVLSSLEMRCEQSFVLSCQWCELGITGHKSKIPLTLK